MDTKYSVSINTFHITRGQCFPLDARHIISHPYAKTDEITVFYELFISQVIGSVMATQYITCIVIAYGEVVVVVVVVVVGVIVVVMVVVVAVAVVEAVVVV
jgi:ABC-type transport system involved in cytochrome bd biosynthesis fused ATPase/permease subunit